MDLPSLISGTSPYPILGVSGGIFHFFPNYNRTFFKQTVKILIRHRIMRCLIWVCTVNMSYKKDARLIWVEVSYLDKTYVYLNIVLNAYEVCLGL